MNNTISSETIEGIIESGAKKLLFEEIIGTDGTNNLDLGHCWFYLK
mgnify:CR=1 FL=1|jgi:hypothetical protein